MQEEIQKTENKVRKVTCLKNQKDTVYETPELFLTITKSPSKQQSP